MRRIALASLIAGCLTAGSLTAASEAQPLQPLFEPADPAPLRVALAALPAHGPPAALVQQPWALPDAHDPALARRWTLAFTAADGAALEAPYRQAVERIGDPWARGAVAFDFAPAPGALQALARLADAAFDHGDFRGFLALSASAPADRRRTVALALCGGGATVDPSVALAPPGVPRAEPAPPAVGDEQAGITVTWGILPDRLLALDPWGRPRWQRRFHGQAEIHAGPGGALVSDQDGCVLVREDGSLAPSAGLPAPGDQRLWFAGSTAWFVRDTAVRGFAVADGAETATTLPEAPLAAPLVRGPASLWLTAHELVLCAGGAVQARIAHGLRPTAGWRLAAALERVFLLAPDGAYRVPPLAEQLAAADGAGRLALLSRAGRHQEVRDAAQLHPPAADDAEGRHALLTAHLALGVPEERLDAVLALAGTPLDEARVLDEVLLARAERGLPPGPAGPRLAALLRAHDDALLPRTRHELAADPATWDHAVSGAALLGLPCTDPRYAIGQAGEATVVTCTVGAGGSGGTLRWRQRWAAAPVVSGAPQHSLALRGDFLVVSEGTGRLVVLEPLRGDALGAIELAQLDAEPTQVTVLGVGGDGVLRLAILHPPAVDDRLTLCGSDGSLATTVLPTSARTVRRISGRSVEVGLGDGRSMVVGDGR